jgi:heme A synthase
MRGHDLFRSMALVCALLCYSTILLGGNVMASDSGLGCPHWPTCYANGSLLPHVTGAAQVEWTHRVSAFVLGSGILVLSLLGVAYERARRNLLGLSLASLGLVVVEALLGGLVVEHNLAIALVLVHLGIATALFGLLLVLAMLSNLRQMPRRWIEWARRAAEESKPSTDGRAEPAAPSPGPLPRPGQG